jgi:transposase-like protein
MSTSKKKQSRHSAEFKEQALAKARARGARTIESVADELNLSVFTLKNWLKTSPTGLAAPVDVALPSEGAASAWSAAQRLEALMQSHALEGEALHAWCREHGVFAHQLTQWCQDFCSPPRQAKDERTQLRELQGHNEQLQRELRRKDKALAEAAALLVLQKKFQALWEDEVK